MRIIYYTIEIIYFETYVGKGHVKYDILVVLLFNISSIIAGQKSGTVPLVCWYSVSGQ